MHVAVVSHTYVELENRGKLKALAGRGVHITAFLPRHWQEAALQRSWDVVPESRPNLDIVPVPVRQHLGSPAAALWDLAPLRDQLREGSFDLVHVEEEPWSLAARSAIRMARTHRVPSVIFTWQNLRRHPRWPLSVIRRRTLRLANGWVAGNRGAAGILRQLDPGHPLIVLPQLGTELPVPLGAVPKTSPELRIGFVGRLVPEKGVADLLDAVATLAVPYFLEIVGDGPDRALLEAHARHLQLTDRVHFRGSVPHREVAELWRRLDVLVLSSRSTGRWIEQFGHVLIEAMAHGVAVIGCDSGAIPEVIGDAGIVVPEGDSAALAAALSKLAAEDMRLAELKGRGRERVTTQYTNSAIAVKLEEFWRGLVGGSAVWRV